MVLHRLRVALCARAPRVLLGLAACSGGDHKSAEPPAMQSTPVLLVGRIDTPLLSIDSSAAEPRLDGSFDLVLTLGADASVATTATVAGFQAMNASSSSTAVPVLHSTTSTRPPFRVSPGEEVHVPFTLEHSPFDDPADVARLCAGPVLIWGALYDSASQVQVGAFSTEFSASGCP